MGKTVSLKYNINHLYTKNFYINKAPEKQTENPTGLYWWYCWRIKTKYTFESFISCMEQKYITSNEIHNRHKIILKYSLIRLKPFIPKLKGQQKQFITKHLEKDADLLLTSTIVSIFQSKDTFLKYQMKYICNNRKTVLFM